MLDGSNKKIIKSFTLIGITKLEPRYESKIVEQRPEWQESDFTNFLEFLR